MKTNKCNLVIVLWMALSVSTVSHAIVPQIERDALVALYNSTDGANWSDNTNWLVGDPCDNNWFAISCTGNHISIINFGSFPGNNLIGTIPIELGGLSNLTRLRMSDNNLSGSIPKELGNLINLKQLFLSNTQLSGSFPAELGRLSNLTDFEIETANITGSIPAEFGGLINVSLFLVSQNSLTGSIPSELSNMSSLNVLHLGENQLSGLIPPELANLPNLSSLYLGSNQLSGSIPPELGNSPSLVVISLARNKLTGSIPTNLGNLPTLKALILSGNQFTGSIPAELSNLSNLLGLNLADNLLSGVIPSELGNLNNLTTLSLDNNQLSGMIPLELGNLSGLRQFHFESNQLGGTIPASFSNLTNLEVKRIHDNAITANLSSIAFEGFEFSRQTIAPVNYQIVASSGTSLSLSWDPILFKGNTGGYKILISDTENGIYTQIFETNSKTVAAYTHNGLTQGQDYYFKLQSFTSPNQLNQNLVVSEMSPALLATTDTTTGNADSLPDIRQRIIRPNNTAQYIISTINNGPDEVIGANFRHNFPSGLINGTWSCSNPTNGASCPPASTGDVDLLVDLPVNASMDFTFESTLKPDEFTPQGELIIDEAGLLVTATMTPPNQIADGNIDNNTPIVDLDVLFEGGFEEN